MNLALCLSVSNKRKNGKADQAKIFVTTSLKGKVYGWVQIKNFALKIMSTFTL